MFQKEQQGQRFCNQVGTQHIQGSAMKGVGEGGRNDPNIVCKYELKKKNIDERAENVLPISGA
jgi:hypothetical protein